MGVKPYSNLSLASQDRDNPGDHDDHDDQDDQDDHDDQDNHDNHDGQLSSAFATVWNNQSWSDQWRFTPYSNI